MHDLNRRQGDRAHSWTGWRIYFAILFIAFIAFWLYVGGA